MKFFAVILLILMVIPLLSGCGNKNESSSEPDKIVVSNSTEEANETEKPFPAEVRGVVFEKAAEQVVSLSPAATQILSELGFEEHLRGVSVYCDHIPKENECEYVGSAENPDIDKIRELNPDLVFTLTELSEREAYALEEAGIKLVVLEQPYSEESYRNLYSDIAIPFVGNNSEIFGNAALASLKSAADYNMGSFIYVTSKLTAAGSNTFENAVLSLIGDNLCSDEGYLSGESLEEEKPDYIIADNSLTISDLYTDSRYSKMMDSGTEAVFVSGVYFERPAGNTSEVFNQIREQIITSE